MAYYDEATAMTLVKKTNRMYVTVYFFNIKTKSRSDLFKIISVNG